MKSVGEAMSIGRNFTEALGKAMRSMETKAAGFWTTSDIGGDGSTPHFYPSVDELLGIASVPTDGRLYVVEQALRAGATVEQVHEATGIDPWFLDQIDLIREVGSEVADTPALTPELLRRAKRHGLSDRQIAALRPELSGEDGVRTLRHRSGIRPVFKTVDTCAAEFAARRPTTTPPTTRRPRSPADRAAQGPHPRQRAQPDRAGHRVRLLLRARGDGAARCGLRDGDGQLQPRDGVHRLRHRGPVVLRAADVRGRPRGGACRTTVRAPSPA